MPTDQTPAATPTEWHEILTNAYALVPDDKRDAIGDVVCEAYTFGVASGVQRSVARFATVAAERDQLRYERRLLGTCRVFLDGLAKTAQSVNLQRAAGDLAQRIVDEIGYPVGLALIEAVDALPHAGESQASEPAPAVGCCPMGTATGTGHEPFCRHRLAGTVPAAPKLATGGIIRRDQAAIVGEQTDGCVVPAERPIDLDDRTPRPVNPFACNKCGCFCGGSHG